MIAPAAAASNTPSMMAQWKCAGGSDLVRLLAECRVADATKQLEQAERWLAAHSDDASLWYALGILCQRQQLWGKAQTYVEASLALDNAYPPHVALGAMLARLGRVDEANAHFGAALKVAFGALARDD